MATDLLNSGMGDEGRLKFILECMEKNKPLYNTDKMYLESKTKQLDDKIQMLQKSTFKTEKPKVSHPKTLISDEHLDAIIDRQFTKSSKISSSPRKKKTFLARIFSR
ncbi:hypothetical protein [Nitrosopumilus adriaticus]|nr:hypothetical protein [Nitrosopumilus adriaticus]